MLQWEALNAAGCDRVFTEAASGASRDRPELKAALDYLRAAGLSETDVARLRASIGLAIGGKAPFEVAIAVLAEITAPRHGAGRDEAGTWVA